MEIRLADLSDLNACLAIEDTFETEYVWQMEEQNRPGSIDVSFRLTRLPRPMRVSNIISRDELIEDYQNGGTLLVADDDGVRGYIDIKAHAWNQILYINNLAITASFRRKGVATRLMRAFASLFIATSASTPLQAQMRDEQPVVVITEYDSVRNLTFPNPPAIDLPDLYR